MGITRPHRKTWWPIGFISLLLLPLIFKCLLYTYPEARELSTIEINLPLPGFWDAVKLTHPNTQMPGEGTWFTFEFSRNEKNNLILFEQLRARLRSSLSPQDTTTSIHIHIDRHASYGSLVQVIDLLNQQNVIYYSFEGSDLWIPKLRPARSVIPLTERIPVCAGFFRQPLTSWEASLASISGQFRFLLKPGVMKVLAPIAAVALLMSLFDLYRIRRKS